MRAIDPAALEASVAAGDRLADEALEALAQWPDPLGLGMLADAARRRRHGSRVTFVRVGVVPADPTRLATAPGAPGEWRLEEWPGLDRAPACVRALAAAAAGTAFTAFSLADVEEAAAMARRPLGDVLAGLADAGLTWLSAAPVDRLRHAPEALEAAAAAGLRIARLALAAPPERPLALLRQVRALVTAGAPVAAFSPLPCEIRAGMPTTGYDDVRLVALSRLVVDNIGSVQIDWRRYGPKLAQVALAFGADDLDAVSPDEAGGRRAPLEEVRRNIQAAGLEPVERDGWFRVE